MQIMERVFRKVQTLPLTVISGNCPVPRPENRQRIIARIAQGPDRSVTLKDDGYYRYIYRVNVTNEIVTRHQWAWRFQNVFFTISSR